MYENICYKWTGYTEWVNNSWLFADLPYIMWWFRDGNAQMDQTEVYCSSWSHHNKVVLLSFEGYIMCYSINIFEYIKKKEGIDEIT